MKTRAQRAVLALIMLAALIWSSEAHAQFTSGQPQCQTENTPLGMILIRLGGLHGKTQDAMEVELNNNGNPLDAWVYDEGRAPIRLSDEFRNLSGGPLAKALCTFEEPDDPPGQPVASRPIYAASVMAVADFNGDGMSDAAVTGYRTDSVTVFLASADGSVQNGVSYPVPSGPNGIIAGDVNGDGKIDLMVVSSGSPPMAGTVSVLLGKGDGTFQPAVSYPVEIGPQSLALGDFNGDGKPDLAVVNILNTKLTTSNVSILIGAGDGTFKPAVSYNVGNAAGAILVADFNSDTKPDVVVPNAVDGTISVLPGNGDGTFRAALTTNIGGSPAYLAAADFNHDGKQDLAVVHTQMNMFSIILGNGDGTFQSPAHYLAGSSPRVLLLLDLNNDGNLDFQLPDESTGELQGLSMLGNPDGTVQAPPVQLIGSGPVSLAVGDFNGDGKSDLATVTFRDIEVLVGNGDGTFRAPLITPLGSLTFVPTSGVVGDFNGDGKPDIAVTEGSNNQVLILLGKGDGTFQAPVSYAAGIYPYFGVTADFNGDGKLDLAIANDPLLPSTNPGNVSILLGNGDGTFQAAVNYATGSHPSRLAVSDLNADGKPDLVVVNNGTVTGEQGSVSILLGKGDGTFQTPVTFTVGFNPAAVAIADLNGDGKPDLAIATGANSDLFSYNIALLFGNGDGTFKPALMQPTSAAPDAIAVADFTGDGKLDLVVAHHTTEIGMTLFAGNGDGTFRPEVQFPAGATPVAVASADFNGDGKPDLAVVNNLGTLPGTLVVETNRLPDLVNVSAASFLETPLAAESIVSAFPIWGAQLATGMAAAKTTPLPENLAGTTVKVRDAVGTERPASLFYASPGQVNYEIPAGTATGIATVTVTSGDGKSVNAPLPIVIASPGLFALDAGGLAAANVLRVQGTTQTVEQVYQVSAGRVVPAPIDLGASTDKVFLLLYGTGIRGGGSASNVVATVGNRSVPVLFAGAQGAFIGLDQVNIGPLPRTLIGSGNVNIVLAVDGAPTNTVNVTIK